MKKLASKLLGSFGAILIGFAVMTIFFFTVSTDIWSDRIKAYAVGAILLLVGGFMIKKSRLSFAEILDLLFSW